MDNKLFAFFERVWNYIDNGKFYREPFRLLYVTIAALNLLFPLFIIYTSIDNGIFKFASGKEIFAFILIFLLLCFLGVMSFHLWMNRQEKVKGLLQEDNEFFAIPVVSHFVQTLGEWLGFYLGVGGCIISLLLLIFASDGYAGYLLGNELLPFGFSLGMIILYPITGFLIVVSGRLMAELYRALASIANNTKRLADHPNGNDPQKTSQENNEL